MPSPVKFSSCRKILSLNMESSEVDDGKSDAIQDQEKSSSPTFAAHEGLMNYTSDPMDFAVIINKTFSNPDELINEYSLNASKDSSKFNTKIFKVVNDSELNKLGSSTNYSPGGKGDMHYDLCQDQTISGQPEKLRLNDVAINASPLSSPIIHKDSMISGRKESLIFDHTAYQIDQAVCDGQKSPSFAALTKMDGSMNSEDFSNFEKNTLRVMKASELNEMGTSSNFNLGGEGDQPHLLCQDPANNGQSIKPVNSFFSPKLHPHDGLASSTFEEIATDAILKSDSGRVERAQLGKINKSQKKTDLHFHPFKKLNVQKEQTPQFSQPIDVTEEAPKDIDDFWFGAQSVGQDFDWTYMRNFKQMYEEDRWENYSYEIEQDEPNHDAYTPASPSFN